MDLTTGDTEMLIEEASKHSLLRNQCAYVLATAYWETARTMRPVVEAYWLPESWRKQHLRYYPWYGRGFVQLTWENNYKRAAKETRVAMDKDPSLALNPVVAAQVAVIGMKEGWFTGKRLSDYITLRNSDFRNARRIINGLDKAGEIAEYAKQYDALLKTAGYGE